MRLRLQARYSLLVVALIVAMLGAVQAIHLLEFRIILTASEETVGNAVEHALYSQFQNQGRRLAKFLANGTADAVYRMDVQYIQDLAAAAREREGVVHVSVFDRAGKLLAESPVGSSGDVPGPGTPLVEETLQSGLVSFARFDDRVYIAAPITAGRQQIGFVTLLMSLAEVRAELDAVKQAARQMSSYRQQRFTALYLAVAVVMIAVGFVASLLMVRGLVQPIRALSRYTRRIGTGNYDDPPPVVRSDELGDLARALGEMARDLKQAAQVSRLATLGDMAVRMAHELSQPLNTIRLISENTLMAMQSGKSDAETEMEKLKLISHQADEMGDLIKRMCVVGRGGGPQELIDVREAVRDGYSLLAGQCEEEGIVMTLDLPAHCRRVLGRRNELAQVVINLLSNACDAVLETAKVKNARPGYGGGRIDIAVRDANEHVTITVKDNGGGLPPDAVDQIFDPFFTTKAVTKGTGLGLSISLGIINAMGGRFEAANFGGGALFTITLPVAPEEAGSAGNA